jgi:nicotinamidase/pyrazinamidase
MQKRSVLLVIDAQNDFMDITGSPLAVPGAVADMERLAKFIEKFNPDSIFASQDSHYALDISHPSWWLDHDGKQLPSTGFVPITADDIKNGKFTPRVDPKASLAYVEALEANGEFGHFIWPEHCLIGTPGHSFLPVFFDAISEWSKKKLAWVNYIVKGTHPYTEHFGIFRANVPNSDPTTQINQGVFNALNTFDDIYVAGEARSHCTANSVRQILQIAPNLAPKMVILEDCMSDVPGLPTDFYAMVDGIYANAKAAGVRFEKTTSI